MAKLPETDILAQAMHDTWKTDNSYRSHIGGSRIGDECERKLWFEFRWCGEPSFDGRIMRLFNRGQNEENTIITELIKCGLRVISHDPQNPTQQIRIEDVDGHFSGSLDSMIIDEKETGLLGGSKKWHVGEYKTHSLKSFNDLVKKGVQESKPIHYAQMQVYMLKTEVDRAVYIAVCKDDDRIHTERVKLDKKFALSLIDKAHRIITAKQSTEVSRVAEDASFFQCKFCDQCDICHNKEVPKPNCRNCIHSTPESKDGKPFWYCEKWKDKIDRKLQQQHHSCHRFLPDLLPYELVEQDGDTVIYKEIRNGEQDGEYSSMELYALPAPLVGNEDIELLRKTFDAKVVKQ